MFMKDELKLVIVREKFNDYSIKELPKGYTPTDFNHLSFKGLMTALYSLILTEFEQ